MKLRRFKVARESIQGPEAVLRDRDEIRHISKVLRLGPGDSVVLFDGEGKEYLASIISLSPGEVTFSIRQDSSLGGGESPLRIVLGQALLKGSKFDWIIQKATELGVAEIVPFHSLRVVPQWERKQIESRRGRWEKIAAEAAKQCGRSRVPLVHAPFSLEAALALEFEGAERIFLWEKEKKNTLEDALVQPASSIYVLVGPEGGFCEREAHLALEAGFHPLGLGPRILRAETAALAILSLIQFLRGDLR